MKNNNKSNLQCDEGGSCVGQELDHGRSQEGMGSHPHLCRRCQLVFVAHEHDMLGLFGQRQHSPRQVDLEDISIT